MSSNIPASHQLGILLASTIEVEKLSSSNDSVELRLAFRGSLLQALYRIYEPDMVAELAKSDEYFQEFLDCPQERWHELARVQQDAIESHALSVHLHHVAALLRKNEYEELAVKVEAWANKNCPKPVLMRDYVHSPMYSMQAYLRFDPGTGLMPISLFSMEDEFFSLGSPSGYEMAPDPEEGPLDWYGRNPGFGVQVREQDEEEQRYSDSVALIWQCEYFEDYMSYGPSNLEPYRSSDPNYPGWESFRAYLQHVVAALQKYNPELRATQLDLHVKNQFQNMPMNLDALSEYFHVIPNLPPNVRSTAGADLSIDTDFPKQFEKLSLSWSTGYDTHDDFSLRTWIKLEQDKTSGDKFKVRIPTQQETFKMGFSTWWIQQTDLDDALRIFDQMKSAIYIAFHAAITDKTRAILEEGKPLS